MKDLGMAVVFTTAGMAVALVTGGWVSEAIAQTYATPPAPMAMSQGYYVAGSGQMYFPPATATMPPVTGGYAVPSVGTSAGSGPYWAPGGYEPRFGSPYHYHSANGTGQFVVTGNPYYDHFGPGFHRDSLYGHYRFPYYNYRAPWYYPGRAVYNRDTNMPW